MRLLLIADEEEPALWDYYRPGVLDGIDCILSAGDLPAEYLRFLVTMANKPLVYVHGNHDGAYDRDPPEGCVCADDRVVTVNGLRILGLGGCPRYSGGPYQYTERQMAARVRRAGLPLLLHGGADILLTHAPARGEGDLEDRAHRGFRAFLPLLDTLAPRYHIHGHVHPRYCPDLPRVRPRGPTTVINACGRYLLDIP